jgi:hypothetical protein
MEWVMDLILYVTVGRPMVETNHGAVGCPSWSSVLTTPLHTTRYHHHLQLLHGVGTFTVMAYFCEYGIGELILPMLLMEVKNKTTMQPSFNSSQIVTHPTLFFVHSPIISLTSKISSPHLNLMRFTAWSEKGLLINMGLFTLTFFGFRLGLCPYLWRDLLRMAFERSDDPLSQSCIPWHFKYFLLVFGIIFNGLNIFWAIKIVKKILRKVTGIEKVHANNEMKDR